MLNNDMVYTQCIECLHNSTVSIVYTLYSVESVYTKALCVHVIQLHVAV